MRKYIAPIMLALVAGSTAVFTPSASALDIAADCNMNTVAQETATGGQNTFTGAASGYAVDTSNNTVTVSCEIRVNSVTVASTPTGSGQGVANTAGQITYTADPDVDDVDLCTIVNGSDFKCEDVTTTQIPPQIVIDTINDLFDLIADATAGLDPVICGIIKTLGIPAIVNPFYPTTGVWVDPDDCDIWVVKDTPPPPLTIFPCPTRIIDFVPYNDPAHPQMPPCP